jgi:uncharacterized iron-regulated membrane protein
MRYSLMLQVVGMIAIILVGAAGLFAWLQNRPVATQNPVPEREVSE